MYASSLLGSFSTAAAGWQLRASVARRSAVNFHTPYSHSNKQEDRGDEEAQKMNWEELPVSFMSLLSLLAFSVHVCCGTHGTWWISTCLQSTHSKSTLAFPPPITMLFSCLVVVTLSDAQYLNIPCAFCLPSVFGSPVPVLPLSHLP